MVLSFSLLPLTPIDLNKEDFLTKFKQNVVKTDL